MDDGNHEVTGYSCGELRMGTADACASVWWSGGGEGASIPANHPEQLEDRAGKATACRRSGSTRDGEDRPAWTRRGNHEAERMNAGIVLMHMTTRMKT